jgi:hypothetical protein
MQREGVSLKGGLMPDKEIMPLSKRFKEDYDKAMGSIQQSADLAVYHKRLVKEAEKQVKNCENCEFNDPRYDLYGICSGCHRNYQPKQPAKPTRIDNYRRR